MYTTFFPKPTGVKALRAQRGYYELPFRAKKYFDIKSTKSIGADGFLLELTQPFSVDTPEHLQFIHDCTEQFKVKLKRLVSIDFYMTMGFAVGVGACLLSFLPVIGWIGFLGWAYGFYQLGQRQFAYQDYNDALNLLVHSCYWSIGPINKATHHRELEQLQSNDVIHAMMKELYPVLTSEQLSDLVRSDIDDQFIKEKSDELEENEPLLLKKETAHFFRDFYGYDKGSYADIAHGLLMVIPDFIQVSRRYFDEWLSSKGEESIAAPGY